MMDLDWEEIKTFKAIAQHGTIRAAAGHLGIHHTTVSRRIADLEDAAGVRLFLRSPDGLELTPAGEALRTVSIEFADSLHAVAREITGQDQALEGLVSVTMAEPLAEHVFLPHLADFNTLHPGIEIRLITSMDFLDVTRREADIAIRMDNNPPETLVGKRLYRYGNSVYANAAYLEEVHNRDQPKKARWLGWDPQDVRYPEWTRSTQFADAPTWGCFSSPRMQQVAARQGLGLAFLPCVVGDSDPALVRATRSPPVEGRDIWILTHNDLRRTVRIRAFMAFAEFVLRKMKPQITGTQPAQTPRVSVV